MFDADFVDRIVDLAKHEVTEINGEKFHVSARGTARIPFKGIENLKVFSLSQLVNFIKTQISEPPYNAGIFINVEGPTLVTANIKGLNKNREYENAVHTDFSQVQAQFPVGKFMDQEAFIVELLSKFPPSPERDTVLSLVANIKSEKIKTSDDDGFSQVVNVKSGVVMQKAVTVPNFFKIQTFKTFPEIEQPKIHYVLRLQQHGDEIPKFALFECDGGQWKVETTGEIRSYLNKNLVESLGRSVTVL